MDGVFAQHKYTPDAATAVVDSVAAGLDSIFTATKDAETLLTAALSAKKVSSAQLDTMAVGHVPHLQRPHARVLIPVCVCGCVCVWLCVCGCVCVAAWPELCACLTIVCCLRDSLPTRCLRHWSTCTASTRHR